MYVPAHTTSPPGASPPSGTAAHVIPADPILSSLIATVPLSVTVPLLLTSYRYLSSSPTPSYDSVCAVLLNPSSRSCSTSVSSVSVSSSPSSAAAAVAVFATFPASTSSWLTV